MTGNEQGSLGRPRPPWERMAFDNLSRAGKEHWRHAVVCADRSAVIERLRPAFLHACEIGLITAAQTEFPRNYFFGEITFTDENRHHEYPWCKDAPQHGA